MGPLTMAESNIYAIEPPPPLQNRLFQRPIQRSMSPAVARSRSEAERGEDTRGEEVHNAYKVHQNMKRSPPPSPTEQGFNQYRKLVLNDFHLKKRTRN